MSESEYSVIAARRFREYKGQKEKESFIRWLVTLMLRILHALIRTQERANIKKAPRVEKINVEREE